MTCESCPFKGCATLNLQDPRTNVDVVFVSESPHLHDFNRNQLFQGQDGHILKRALIEAGFSPSTTLYATSAIACLPPKDAKKTAALGACQERLHRQLTLAQPKVILAMGNSALESVLQQDGLKVTQMLGSMYQSEFGPVIPCLAPAALEYMPKEYPKFVKAIEHLVQFLADENQQINPITKFRTLKRDEVEEWCMKLSNYPKLALDIETEGFDRRIREAINLGICWEAGKAVVIDSRDFDLIGPLFNGSAKQVWHNGKFDVHFLRFRYGHNAIVHHDTILQHYLLDEAVGSHDLEQLAMRYLRAKPYEHGVRKYLDSEWGYKFAPRGLLEAYLAKDVDYTFRLDTLFRPQIMADSGFKFAYEQLLIPGSEFLVNMEDVGMPVDTQRLKEVDDEFKILLDESAKRIQSIAVHMWDPKQYAADTGAKTAPVEFLPSSPKQLKWLLYDRLRLRSTKKRAKKDTNENTLKTLVPKHSLVEEILNHRGLQKIHSTYVVGVEKRIMADVRVHSTFNLFGSVTGRLSSRNPNIQNIPRTGPAKSIYLAPEGYVFIEADYSGAELRVLAVASGDQNMRDVFIQGRDLHDETTAGIFGPNFTSEQRVKVGKAVNFGIMYGMQEDTLAERTQTSKAEAKGYLERWAATYPAAWDFIQSNRDIIHVEREVRAITGRRRRFHLIPDRLKNAFENEATNFPIQGPASDCTLRAGIELQSILRDRFGADICNIVHDALYVIAPNNPDVLTQIYKVMSEIMIDVPRRLLQTDVPFEVEFKIGQRLSEMKKVDYHKLIKELAV